MDFDQLREDCRVWHGLDIDKLHPYYLDELRGMTEAKRTTALYLLTAATRAAEVPFALDMEAGR